MAAEQGANTSVTVVWRDTNGVENHTRMTLSSAQSPGALIDRRDLRVGAEVFASLGSTGRPATGGMPRVWPSTMQSTVILTEEWIEELCGGQDRGKLLDLPRTMIRGSGAVLSVANELGPRACAGSVP